MSLLKHEGVQSSVEGVCTEEELKESRKEFQTLFNRMPDPVVIVDKMGKILAVNDKTEEITGFKREELLGKNFLRIEIATAKSKAILMKNLAKRMMGINIAPYEVEGLTKNGKKIPFEVNATKIEYGEKPADLVIFRDITERKKTEEALKESEEKFRNLAEQSPNMIFINKKGRIVYANKKCEDIVGYKKKEFYSPGFSFLTLIAPESVDLVKSKFGRHMKDKDVIPYEYRLVTKEGKKIEAILTSKLIKYEGENAILGTVTDITERKKMEEK
ncbi:MAG: PAS domain-containing protein, partial [Candidatus Bathyarchaeota archaeon]|nr:PAS domain-containing protein [Candidatus Bathyarchaeota archaeon]